MPYDKEYLTTNANDVIVNLFGTAISSTVSWIDMLIILVVMGIVLSLFMGILFRFSHALGF